MGMLTNFESMALERIHNTLKVTQSKDTNVARLFIVFECMMIVLCCGGGVDVLCSGSIVRQVTATAAELSVRVGIWRETGVSRWNVFAKEVVWTQRLDIVFHSQELVFFFLSVVKDIREGNKAYNNIQIWKSLIFILMRDVRRGNRGWMKNWSSC